MFALEPRWWQAVIGHSNLLPLLLGLLLYLIFYLRKAPSSSRCRAARCDLSTLNRIPAFLHHHHVRSPHISEGTA
jgi:hypothetical protein